MKFAKTLIVLALIAPVSHVAFAKTKAEDSKTEEECKKHKGYTWDAATSKCEKEKKK